MGAFKSYHYSVEVLSPVFIGGAKENDYSLGEDYYFDQARNEYCFYKKREVIKAFTPQQFDKFTKVLSNGNGSDAAKVVAEICRAQPALVYKKLFCPFAVQENIKRHIANGFGQLYIPGSSVKGALRSIIGKYLMFETRQREFREQELFGKIGDNFMRLLQVADVAVETQGGIFPFKIFSGDVVNQIIPKGNVLEYNGEGMWKHERVGNHGTDFSENGFVTYCECLLPGLQASLRLNWADGLKKLFDHTYKPHNVRFAEMLEGNLWMDIARNQMNDFIDQEIAFYDKFYNEDFNDVFRILEKLKGANNRPGSVIIRLGQGSGYHAITGNWKFIDHTQTGQADDSGRQINAIKYKTRKMAFHEKNSEELEFFLPGFVKISAK